MKSNLCNIVRVKSKKIGHPLVICLLLPFALLLVLIAALRPSPAQSELTTSHHSLQQDQIENKPLKGSTETKALSQTDEIPRELPKTRTTTETDVLCDFSSERSDTCTLNGDVRILGKSSVIVSISSSNSTEWKIRPYTRKWEDSTMQLVKELSVISSSDPSKIPQCEVKHKVPALVFSTGGFVGNFFHDFTDEVVPLFLTAYRFKGKVQLAVSDMRPTFIERYDRILKHLSNYDIIDMEKDTRTHCFSHAQVGLLSHKPLGIDPSRAPNGYSMKDFREFLRASFSLPRDSVGSLGAKPRLLILVRKGSRAMVNHEEVVSLAKSIGFEVVAAGPEETRDLPRFAESVNSCDVMVGVHGAGLTNMVFLPTNATVLQIIPWGELKYGCRYAFGEPAVEMGLRYMDYEITAEESTLIERFPRDDEVFTDPLSVHKRGPDAFWNLFLNGQNVRVDVKRFKGVLVEVFRSLERKV